MFGVRCDLYHDQFELLWFVTGFPERMQLKTDMLEHSSPIIFSKWSHLDPLCDGECKGFASDFEEIDDPPNGLI